VSEELRIVREVVERLPYLVVDVKGDEYRPNRADALAALDRLQGSEQARAVADRMLADEEFRAAVIADYDRRRRTRWGRFLLWLLRRTT
jgi:hypothetical protein